MTAQTHRLNDIQFYYEYRVDSIANALLSGILLCVSIAHDTDYENSDTVHTYRNTCVPVCCDMAKLNGYVLYVVWALCAIHEATFGEFKTR